MPSRAGKPNKAKADFRSRLQAYCTRHKVDPFYAMVKMLADDSTQPVLNLDGEVSGQVPTVPMGLKFQCAKELCQYLQPKLRSVTVAGDPEQPLEILHRYGRADTAG